MSISQSSNPRVNYYIKNIVAIIISILYAVVLSSFSNDLFYDRENYIIYATYSNDILNSYSSLSYLFNEPLFLYYNSLLSNLFPFEVVPKIGVFFTAFTLMYFISKYAESFLKFILGFLLLIFVSYTFHLQLVALRQGIATAFFIWIVYFFWNKKIFYPLCLLLPFFHSSFFIISAVLLYNDVLSYKIKDVKKLIIILIISLSFFSLFLLQVASILGVRQATEDHLLTSQNSGGGFVLFLFIFLFMFFRGLNNIYRDKFGKIAILGLVVYLTFYFTIPISGRIIGTFLPFMYVYIVSSRNIKVAFASIVFLIVNIYLFHSSVTNNSLTLEGVRYFNKIFFIG